MRTLLAVLILTSLASGAGREVAITFDDLPRGGDGGPQTLASVRSMTNRLLAPLREQKIPVIGFVNEGRSGFTPDIVRAILELWLNAGADLGNHSYSHANLNQIPLTEYEADILRGETGLGEVLAAHRKKLEFFRHPYLFTGQTEEVKRSLEAFLSQHGYRAAPVTIDVADYLYANVFTRPEYTARVRREYIPYLESVVEFFEERSVEVTGHEIRQVMILHANELNAQTMPEIIAMFRRRGYTFITLDRALQDDAYKLPDNYFGKGGFSWIHRWSMTKGMKGRAEPDPPEWVNKASAAPR